MQSSKKKRLEDLESITFKKRGGLVVYYQEPDVYEFCGKEYTEADIEKYARDRGFDGIFTISVVRRLQDA